MDKEQAEQIIQQLRNKELDQYKVAKEDFPVFRETLISQDDIKDFRGNAQHFGAIIYTYQPGWTA
ncbi:hypothetical protein JCM19046_62 [Bacillus sp. JCM 19046]|uniref:Uncharacterized protein n=1 Tax=Shouchella xiaoxiensis TaxID=766895 RepID=A0ABS2SUZ4_9BACI|nr:hypothetical protein [Shouchella xiaoxiensis]MBM7839294.1 hypothetical protein [Shouchella xiaoxiensis]GAF13013.1 hypothetical protein JCM19045_2230 [Bacillus sp. JCM 19045]GAF15668.1 hypothetical protein JCM19046_62 [Bacillus sp. JCM 19046]